MILSVRSMPTLPTFRTVYAGLRSLRRERNGSRSGESVRERGEDAELSVKLHALKATDAERAESGFMLQASEVDGATS
jgi:hypothetical protein